MLHNRFPHAGSGGERVITARKGSRDRRFEALYMQSFVEMRARSPKR